MNNWLGELWHRLRFLISRQQFERDLEEEMRLHKELRAQEYRNMGVDQDSARYASHRRFGNALLLKEASHEMWGWYWLETLVQDLRYAFRKLGGSPGFTAAALLSLAFGIGANTAVFTLINALLLRMLPVREPQQLVLLGRSSLETNDAHSFPYPFYRELRDNNPAFSGVLCYTGISPALNVNGTSERVSGELVSGNYFDVLGVKPYIGRLFTREDDNVPGAERVAVLSHGFRARRFGADPGIVGKVIHLNTVPMTVIGISPPRFDGLDIGQSADIRVPIVMQAEMWADRSLLESRGDWWLRLVARLKPGITRVQAEAAIQPLLMAYARTEMQANPTKYQRRLFASHRVVLDSMARGEQNPLVARHVWIRWWRCAMSDWLSELWRSSRFLITRVTLSRTVITMLVVAAIASTFRRGLVGTVSGHSEPSTPQAVSTYAPSVRHYWHECLFHSGFPDYGFRGELAPFKRCRP